MTSSPVPYEIRTAVPNDLPRLIDLIADHADILNARRSIAPIWPKTCPDICLARMPA